MLRDYQIKSEQSIFDAYNDGHKKVMFQLPTGGGKTVIITSIIRKILMQNMRVIFIAHREELISQAWETFYKNKIFAGIIKSGVAPNLTLPCQVASIQTIIRRDKLPAANVVIIDESHHALEDNSYGMVIQRHYPDALVLGVTGTPYRLGGKGFTSLFDTLVESVQLKDLIDMGYLVPLRYFVSSIPDLSKVKMSKGDYEIDAAAASMELAPIVESYLEHCKGLVGMVFACNVQHSKKIVSKYLSHGIKAAHIDANTPQEMRKEIIGRFKRREISVLVNVGIATEGFDSPDMDFIQLARPTKSLSLFYQMVGRVTRANNETIKDAGSPEQRRFLISCSSKPYGIILDNAGLWKDHGLPDQPQNWQNHFKGYDKKKKPTETIELIEFVAEDESGRTVRTKVPKEIEGMKLVEITRTQKDKIVNLLSLKEFDKMLALYTNIPRIQKVAFNAINDYIKYCKKNSFLMSEETWDYLILKACKEPLERENAEIAFRDRTIGTITDSYEHNPEERDSLIAQIERRSNDKLARIRRCYMSEGFINKKKHEYFNELELKSL